MKSLACGMNHHSFRVTGDVDVHVGAACTCKRAHAGVRESTRAPQRRRAGGRRAFISRIGLHDRHLISQVRAQWDTPYLLPFLYLVSLSLFLSLVHIYLPSMYVCQDYVEARLRARRGYITRGIVIAIIFKISTRDTSKVYGLLLCVSVSLILRLTRFYVHNFINQI